MFITIEGVEGAGKSTLANLLIEELKKRGISVLYTMEPGGCILGRQIRPLLLHVSNNIDPLAELFLFLADRAQHVEEVIRPALYRGEWVICDRYIDSTIAYQGYGRGLDIEKLKILNQHATGGLEPDITLLLDVSPMEGLVRAKGRNEEKGISRTEGRFEEESFLFHRKIRNGFLTLATENPKRISVLDAGEKPEELFRQAMDIIDKKQN